MWEKGLVKDWKNGGWESRDEDLAKMTWEEWWNEMPQKEDYMPEWSEKELTHIMMYETVTEGTPISPAFKTPKELAGWLTYNNASAFGGMTASYESWLRTINRGFAVSAVFDGKELKSGVEM